MSPTITPGREKEQSLFLQGSQPSSQTPSPPSPFPEMLPCQTPGSSAPPSLQQSQKLPLSQEKRNTRSHRPALCEQTPYPTSLQLVCILLSHSLLPQCQPLTRKTKNTLSHPEIYTVVPRPPDCAAKAPNVPKMDHHLPSSLGEQPAAHSPASPTAQPHNSSFSLPSLHRWEVDCPG